MIGVVIWSSSSTEKAVIWCEDQGPLAYLQGTDDLAAEIEWPVPGDLLHLDCENVGNLRHARSVRIVSQQACPQLPMALRNNNDAAASHLHLVSSRSSRRVSDRQNIPAASDGRLASNR